MSDNVLDWSKSIIMATPARWLALVQSTPVELLSMRPAPGEWSALDCLQHLVDVEQTSFPVRIKALLTGADMAAFNPDDRPEQAPPSVALAAIFDQLRNDNLALLAQVTEADLDRRAHHAEYGMVSMREFLNHWAAHDLNHTIQAERAIMQSFIKGSGPWETVYSNVTIRGN